MNARYYVYVLGDADNPMLCKVGISSDWIKRLAQIQRSAPMLQLEAVGMFAVPSRRIAYVLEQEALAHFSIYRIGKSEWLRVPAEAVGWFIMASARRRGVALDYR